MSLENLNHQLHLDGGHDKAFVLLHGISEGMDSEFMQAIYTGILAKGKSVFAFDFPYLGRKAKPTNDLSEEIATLQEVTEYLHNERYKHISIVAKSLGGSVASRWLRQYPDNPNVTVNILGYVLGDVDTAALKNHLGVVIQGQRDRFGDANAVRKELRIENINSPVLEVRNADHSYRNKTGQPVYQPQAINMLIKNCL